MVSKWFVMKSAENGAWYACRWYGQEFRHGIADTWEGAMAFVWAAIEIDAMDPESPEYPWVTR